MSMLMRKGEAESVDIKDVESTSAAVCYNATPSVSFIQEGYN